MERFDDLAREAGLAFTAAGADREVTRANLGVATALGLPALTVPRELGGHGANLLEFASYQQILARGDGATALVLAMHHMLLGGEADAEPGGWPRESWEETCRAAVADGALVNSAATEPGAGTPSQAGIPSTMATLAVGSEGEAARWEIRGRKTYTTGAPYLRFIRVSARVEPRGEAPFGARFLLRLPAPGVRLEDSWRPSALAAAANDDV
ncbi:MAG: acyl-CoA/acyl-ACP dehydrogenase, partial [Candidatus Dormibacteraeota bacterium]|nr:acyl-CoA/acyl-ACP dehydrogenase [Candidatus Dormibacteraeota bacterium]